MVVLAGGGVAGAVSGRVLRMYCLRGGCSLSRDRPNAAGERAAWASRSSRGSRGNMVGEPPDGSPCGPWSF